MIHHKGLFEKYKGNKTVFIETGTYWGLGVRLGLEAGYDIVRSVELAPIFYERAVATFKNEPKVKLYQGTSESNLWEMIKDIDSEITFWLDAHYAGDTGYVGPEKSPIIKELTIIGQHPIKTHTILIDDVRDMGTIHFDMVTKETVIKQIMKINPNYKITYEDGSAGSDASIFPNDILTAYI